MPHQHAESAQKSARYHRGYLNVPGGKTPLKWRSRRARPSRSDVFPPGTFRYPLWYRADFCADSACWCGIQCADRGCYMSQISSHYTSKKKNSRPGEKCLEDNCVQVVPPAGGCEMSRYNKQYPRGAISSRIWFKVCDDVAYRDLNLKPV
jgi:hypothetical protein